jgi:hypothetical protein
MKDRRSLAPAALIVMLTLLAALGPLTAWGPLIARFGPAGKWVYLASAAPQGWVMGVMTYTLLKTRPGNWQWPRSRP